MKKSLLALCVLGSLASVASAQSSSVTLYGVVDLGLRNVNNNSGSQTTMVPSASSSSRLGFRGTEDLGGGLSTNFVLEADVYPDTGAAGGNTVTPTPAGQFFSRMSWLSLKSASAGEIRLGRDYTPLFMTQATYDPFGFVGVGALSNTFSSTQNAAVFSAFGLSTAGANTLIRANNSIAYHTPNTLGGFFGSAQYAFSEGALTSAGGASKFLSGRFGYGSGPLKVEATFAETKNTNIPGQSFKETATGGSYDFGVAKVMATWTQMKHVDAKADLWLIGATAPLGNGSLKVSYVKINQSGTTAVALGATPAGGSVDDRDASQLAIGYTYDLSKRTALYAHAARLANKGSNAGFAIAGGPAFAAGNNRKSTAYEFGMRHSF